MATSRGRLKTALSTSGPTDEAPEDESLLICNRCLCMSNSLVNRLGFASSINYTYAIVLKIQFEHMSNAALTNATPEQFRAVVYQIDNHHMWIKFQVN